MHSIFVYSVPLSPLRVSALLLNSSSSVDFYILIRFYWSHDDRQLTKKVIKKCITVFIFHPKTFHHSFIISMKLKVPLNHYIVKKLYYIQVYIYIVSNWPAIPHWWRHELLTYVYLCNLTTIYLLTEITEFYSRIKK